jgi:glycosyltransferase involved in cell wall biosynthesis
MPVRCVDVELSEPLQPIWDMEGYEGANLLVRYRGTPIGWAYAVGSNRSFISPDRISQAIDHHISWQCVEAVLGNGPDIIDPLSAALPPISVIVCRGAAKDLDECLARLRRLTYREFELIVVEYGPSRPSCTRFEHPDIRHVDAGESNLAGARNRGVAAAKHDVVAFIDQDGFPDPQWLHAVGRALSSRHIQAVCGLIAPAEMESSSHRQWKDGGHGFERRLERAMFRRARLTEEELLRAADFGGGGNMAFRRSVLQQLGGFDPRYNIDAVSGGCETELLHRLVARGHVLLYEPNALTWRRPARDPKAVYRGAYERGKSMGLYMLMCLRKHTVRRQALLRFGLHEWAWRRIVRPLLKPRQAARSLAIVELAGTMASPITFWRARNRFGMPAAEATANPVSMRPSLRKRLQQVGVVETIPPDVKARDGVRGHVKVVRTWYPHWGEYSGVNQYLKHINPRLYRTTTLLVHENDSQFVIRNHRVRDWLRYWSRKHDMAWYNLSDLQAEWSMLKSCLFERPNVVHYLDGEHAAQWLPRLSSLPARMRPAFVVSYHQPPDVMEYAIRKEAVDWFDHIIAVAPEQLDFLHRFTSSAKTSLILHGIDTDFFRPPPQVIPHDSIRCLSVGHNYRDYSTIRQVALNLREHSRIEFHIVSPKPTGLEGLQNVVVHTDVDDAALLELYQTADILLLPLVKATANNALLEGIACGLPVITTYLPSIKAYLPGPEAILIEGRNPSDYTEAVLSLSRDPGQRKQMGALARKRAEELSWTKITAQYEAIYSRLISR